MSTKIKSIITPVLTEFIKVCASNISFNHVDSLFPYVVTSQYFCANIIFTAEIIECFTSDIGTVKIIIEYLHYKVNVQ